MNSRVSNFITISPFHIKLSSVGEFSVVDSEGLYLSLEKESENSSLCLRPP